MQQFPASRSAKVELNPNLLEIIMKSIRLLSVLAILGFASAVSAEGPVNYPDLPEVPSTLTRAQVTADVLAARSQGLFVNGDAEMPIKSVEVASTKTRAQVVAEMRAAQALGLMIPAGEAAAPIATVEQEKLIAEAGLQARDQHQVATR